MTMTPLEKHQSFFKRLAADDQAFYDELKRQDRVFNILMGVIITVFVLGMAYAIGLAIYNAANYRIWYEYIDVDGQTGTADDCYTSDGNMVCKEGQTTKKVVEYTKFSEHR